jgi:hexulose-6-phosphate isomerase
MLGPWRLGVMQGRLLPKYKGRYQAHPKGTWPDEFDRAAGFGLDLVEFILDYEDAAENPLLDDPAAILAVSARTGVGVASICADYFMEAPLHRGDRVVEAAITLEVLLDNAARLGVGDVVIPCVDQSRIDDAAQEEALVAALTRALPQAERLGVNLSLETDLDPARFARLLKRLPSPRVTVNYDIGNSASWGYDPVAEWTAYGARVSDVHIKDRVQGGGSVELGTGNADIPLVLRLMAEHGFTGPVIMQAFRDDEGLAVFGRQLAWLREKVG